MARHLQGLGFKVVSLDVEQSTKADICVDILNWDYKVFPPHYFRIISAGVPCTEFSTAKTVGTRDLQGADRIVLRTLEIIEYFRPEIWWVENPRGGSLRNREFMKGIPFLDVDYCQFSDWGNQKPTRIWGCPRISKLPTKVCDHITCRNLVEVQGGGGETGRDWEGTK